MAKITLKELREKKACKVQLALFRKRFGEEVEVTFEEVMKVSSIFDWDWAARNLLSPKGHKAFEAVIFPAWRTYRTAEDSAWIAYDTKRATAKSLAWADYRAAINVGWEDYNTAKASARKAYHDAKASAWFAVWEKDHTH